MVISISVLSQEQINLPGFGNLPVTKSNNEFIVDFPKYGQFSFTGSVEPLALETEATIDQLKKIPGYSILANLGLKDIKLKLSNSGFEIEALADTKENLAGLFNMLKVGEPLMAIGAKITSRGFALSGEMDFTRKPIVLNLVPNHTRFTYERVTIDAEVGANDGDFNPGITAKIEMRIKPTKWDPDLKTVMAVSYDLISQEITASGSMVDTWKNPIGISNLLKKDVMSFTNTAVSLGWIPGAPSPTTIGFAIEQGKIFHLDFGVMMALSPADGEIALWGFRDRMTMNDFTSVLRDGFGLKVPDVFPKDIYIEDANILFSPNGGEVGEFEIEPGFAMRGRVKFLGAVDGSLNFYANMDDGFFVDFKLDAAFKDALMKEIRKVDLLAPIMEQVLSTLEVHRVRLYLEAGTDLNLEGQTNVHISVLNKPIKFDFKGSFNPKTLAQEIVKRIVDAARGEAAAAVKKIARDAANASIKTAKAGYDKLGYYAKHATTWKDHATHGSRVPITGKLIHPSCYDKCVPQRANNLSNPVYESSNKAVKDFYDKVYPKVAAVAGKSLREEYIKADWNRLTSSIDNNWERIIRDDHYMGYDKDQKDVEKLGRRYRELVRAKKQEHVNYRNNLWNLLMTEKHFLFFDSSTGSAEIYKVAANGGLGLKVNSIDGTWRTTWTDIEYYSAGGKDLVLFYQQADGGVAEMYEKGEHGGLGRKVTSTSNWKATWSDIEYYQAGGQDMMLFYEQAGGGSAAMYKLKNDGTLGTKVASTNNWRATWSEIEYYRAGGQDMMLFYEKVNGFAEMYHIKTNGTLGKKVTSTNNWRKTWTDIEYFQAGGKDMLLFYEQSTGYAVMYEVAKSGGLGKVVYETNNWRKTWTEIEFY